MQPFSGKTVEVLILATATYLPVYFLLNDINGLLGLFTRTIAFAVPFLLIAYYRNISPDLKPVVYALLKRAGIQK